MAARLRRVVRGEAGGLIVAKLDRFARSTVGALAAVKANAPHGCAETRIVEETCERAARLVAQALSGADVRLAEVVPRAASTA